MIKKYTRYSLVIASSLLIAFGSYFSLTAKAKLSKKEIVTKKVKFQNYNEKKAPLWLVKKQMNNGAGAAEQMKGNTKKTVSAKYYVIKRIYNKNQLKFGADIVYVKKKFPYKHIHSIKRFLIGYLKNAFDYKQSDARIIATFILHYNGYNYKNYSYFKDNYTPEAYISMNPSKVGIHKSFKMWPGKAEIVIPLKKNILKPDNKDIGIEEIIAKVKPVLEKKEEGVEEIKEIEEVVEVKKEEEKEIVKEEIKKADKKLNELADYIISEDLTEDEKAQIEDQIKEIKENKKELKEKQDELGTDEKVDEAYDKNVVAGKIYVLKNINYLKNGHYNNEVLLIDPVKDNFIKIAGYKNICGQHLVEFGGGIIVVGHKKGHEGEHFLVKLDLETLDVVKYGDKPVFWRSQLIVKDKSLLYTIESDEGKYYLARYNTKLKRIARSSAPISKDSHVTFFGSKIYVTGTGSQKNKVVVLNKDDLKILKSINQK